MGLIQDHQRIAVWGLQTVNNLQVPRMAKKEEHLYRGEMEDERAIVNKGSWLFIG